MAYTLPWDTSDPIGTIDANLMDNAIRDFKVQVEERMDDVLGGVGRWAADPVLAPADLLVKRRVPWFAGRVIASTGTLDETDVRVKLSGASCSMILVVPLLIPDGATLTKVDARLTRTSGDHTAGASLFGKTASTTPFNQTLVTVTMGGFQTISWTGEHVASVDNSYFVKATMDNNNLSTGTTLEFYDVYYEYTVPNLTVR